MKKILFTVCLCGLCIVNAAFGEYVECTDGRTGELLNLYLSADCTEVEYTCYDGQENYQSKIYAIQSCIKCRNGMVPSSNKASWEVPGYGTVEFVHFCELYLCSNDPTCVSDATYKSGNTGYEYKTNRSCSNNKCVESNVYRCASGYYGSSTNGTTGCTQCPPDPKNDKNLGQSTPGTTSIIECYLKTESASKDDTGEFIYKNDCYYKQ